MLKKAPERRLSRAEVEEVLVAGEGFHESNVLRAIRGLTRENLVTFKDRRRKANSVVELLLEVEPVPEAKLAELLAELGGKR